MRRQLLLLVCFLVWCIVTIKGQKHTSYREVNEDEDNVYKPCPHSEIDDRFIDEDCVRQFITDFGQCKKIDVEERKSFKYRDGSAAYIPKLGATLITSGARVRHPEGDILAFYINKKNGNMVMSANLRIEMFCRSCSIFLNRMRKEPLLLTDEINLLLPITVNAVFNIRNGITKTALSNAIITAEPFKSVKISGGDKIKNNDNEVVQNAVAELKSDVQGAAKEFLLTEAPNFFIAYLQSRICDFNFMLGNVNNLQGVPFD